MAMRLFSATGRPLAALALLTALCACATSALEPSHRMPPVGWQIVERTGKARYLPPGAAAWLPANTGQALDGGGEIATGTGGRLIVAAPGRHLTVGPDTRFVLPDEERDQWLEQRAGWLRYRIAKAGLEPFRIHTRSLELELSAGVVDVHVNHLATEVTVKEGQVRVATPDGLRQTQMIAGQSAQAGTRFAELAVRRAPGEALQPVDAAIVPAIQPRQAHGRAAAAEALPATQAIAPALMTLPAIARPQGHAARGAGRPGGSVDQSRAQREAGRVGIEAGPHAVPDRAGAASLPAPSPTDPAAIQRAKFDRLTAGMIDGIRPALAGSSVERPIR